MVRAMYAGRPGDTVAGIFDAGDGSGRKYLTLPVDANGQATDVALEVWDVPGGTRLTDLLAADGVTPITEVVAPAETGQIPAFYCPNGVVGVVWLKDPDGDYTRLDIGPQGASGTPGVVTSVNGHSASSVTVVASDVPFTPVGAIAAATVQLALAELDTEKQPLDADLTAIAALTTTSYGRALLALSNQAALMALLSAATTGAAGVVPLATSAETVTGTVTTKAVTPAGVAAALAALVGTVPSTLDTLDELANALGDDPAFATTITTLIGTKQAGHANLTAFAGLTLVADRLPYANGAGTLALATFTAAARALLDDADSAAMRATLGAMANIGGGQEVKAALSATTGTCTGNLSAASIFTVVPSGNITLAFSNIPAGPAVVTAQVDFVCGATVPTITYPAGTIHAGGAAVAAVANKTLSITMQTYDGGTIWKCSGVVFS